ncbi:MAG: hypothetical protein JOZ41_14295, partial [Chloroflexi bacterium]|nr:hypothetical protein [Chloroflexota bacterium]
HFLLRQPGPHPPLLVGAYRRDEVVAGGALALLLEEPGCETSAGRTVRRIELAPLGEQDLARLFAYHASGPCSPDLVRGLHARCGGNPYFGLQMLALLRQEGRLVDGPDGWQIAPGPPVGLPPAVRETVARRLRNLSPDAQEVLALGAVLGREFDAVVLEAFWERGEHELFDALDRAMAQGVLEETTRGYTFSHPLLREVVYRQLSVRRRERLHARVADTLEGVFGVRADEHAAEIAHHLLEAGSVDRGRIVRYLTLAAGRATDVYAWEEALHLYRAALQQEDDEDRVAPLLEQVASALQSLGRYEEALQALEIVAQQHRRAGDIEQEGAVAAQIAEIHFLRGTVQAGAERIRPILDQLEQTSAGTQAPSRALAALYSALARLTGTTLPLIERAVEVARATGDDRLLATAEVRRAIALIQRGRGEEARQVLEDALPLVEATGDYATLHLALGVLSETLKASGEFESCLAWRERVLHRAEHIGDPLQLVSALAHVGESLFLLGDWAGARQHHERALELGQSITTPWHTAFALLGMAELEVAQGNWEEAARCIATCLTDAERLGHGNWVRNAQRLMGDLEVRRGRTAEGTRRLESLAKEEGKEIPATLFRLAWAYLESGNETEADATIQRAAALARAGHRRFDLCESLIVQGRVYLGQNRVQEVEPVLSEALSLARTMPYPYAEARVLIECARRAGALGDRDQERIHTDLAHGILRRLGARPDLERTEALKMTRQRRDA